MLSQIGIGLTVARQLVIYTRFPFNPDNDLSRTPIVLIKKLSKELI